MTNRSAIIRELRHQLYFTNPGPERDAVLRQLNFWLSNSPATTHARSESN